MNLQKVLVLTGAVIGLGLSLKFGGFGSGPGSFSALFSAMAGAMVGRLIHFLAAER